MSNKLSLLVNFIAVDKMSGALRNFVGLGREGSKSLKGLNGEARKLSGELAKVEKAIAKGTGNLTALIDRERELKTALQSTNQQLEKQKRLAEIEAGRRAMVRRGDELMAKGQGNVMGGVGMAIPLLIATKQAMTFEAAMADVRKVVNFPSPKSFARMSSDVLTLSTRIPMAAEGIAAIVAAAGRANVPRQELLRFAEDAAKMGVAFDMTGDEAGAMMAKWRTAFSMSQSGVTDLADQINALTNAYGGNATDVSAIVTRIGALGKVAGVSASLVAGMGQVLNSVGVEEEIAATGIKNMMLAMTKGAAATKSQKAAFAELGLDAGAVSRRMQSDAKGAITDILARIGKLPKAQQAASLTNLFGSESVAAIAPLLVNLDKLQTNFGLVGDKAQFAGSMQKEYLARLATTEGATGLALNALKAANIELGQALLPTLTDLSKTVVDMAQSFRGFAAEHPALIGGIVKLAAAGVGLRIGLGALQFAFGGLLGPAARFLTFFQKVDGISKFGIVLGRFANIAIGAGGMAVRAFGMIRMAMLFLAQGVMRAGAMMLANPIVLIITAIVAAVGVAAYLIYTHWDKISATFRSGVQWVKNAIAGLPDWLRGIGSAMMQGLLSMIDPFGLRNRLLDVARNGVNAFKAFFGIKSPSRLFMAMGGHLTSGLALGVAGGAPDAVRSVRRMATGVAAAGAISLAPVQPALARPGGLTPIRPASPALAAAARGGPVGGAPIEIHVHPAPGQSPDEIAEAVMRKLERAKGMQARRSFEGDR